jgi:hypothetical protein
MVDIFHYDDGITSKDRRKNHERVFWLETFDDQFSDNGITYNLYAKLVFSMHHSYPNF